MSTGITLAEHSITYSTDNPHHKYLTHLPLCHFNCQSVSPSTQPSLATSVCISTGNLFHLFIFIRHIPASPHPSLHCSTLQRSLWNDRGWVEMREVTSGLEWEGCRRKGLCEAQLGDVSIQKLFWGPFTQQKAQEWLPVRDILFHEFRWKWGYF